MFSRDNELRSTRAISFGDGKCFDDVYESSPLNATLLLASSAWPTSAAALFTTTISTAYYAHGAEHTHTIRSKQTRCLGSRAQLLFKVTRREVVEIMHTILALVKFTQTQKLAVFLLWFSPSHNC